MGTATATSNPSPGLRGVCVRVGLVLRVELVLRVGLVVRVGLFLRVGLVARVDLVLRVGLVLRVDLVVLPITEREKGKTHNGWLVLHYKCLGYLLCSQTTWLCVLQPKSQQQPTCNCLSPAPEYCIALLNGPEHYFSSCTPYIHSFS